MRRRTSPIWSRWELNPPTITLRDAARLYAGQVDVLRHHGLIKPTAPATAYQCRDCGEHQAIAYMSDRDERQHGFIVCGDCGPCEVPAESLEQVVFDTEASLAHLFSGARLSIKPLVADRLWKIGRHTFAGQSRELWFVRNTASDQLGEVVEQIALRPRTILFMPLVRSATHLSGQVSNLVIGLEDIIDTTGHDCELDWHAIEDHILESMDVEPEPTKPKPRRSSRATNIERLIDELTQHLRSAADHARETGDLLPRPTQQELGQRTGMSKSDVSRCINDSSADKLRLLWRTADDLEAVVRLPSRQLR